MFGKRWQINFSREYNIGRAKIHDIKQKKDQIKSFFKSNESSTTVRKSLKSGDFPLTSTRSGEVHVKKEQTHAHFRSNSYGKHSFFFNKILRKDDFRASLGWLDKFKRDFGIRLLTVTSEKLSWDVEYVEPFIETLKNCCRNGTRPGSGLFCRWEWFVLASLVKQDICSSQCSWPQIG